MKVSELIEELHKYDGDAEVMFGDAPARPQVVEIGLQEYSYKGQKMKILRLAPLPASVELLRRSLGMM